MKGLIIGTSVFSVNDTGWLCDIGFEPHDKAVIMERRSDTNSIGTTAISTRNWSTRKQGSGAIGPGSGI